MTLAVRQGTAPRAPMETIDEKARWCQMMADGDMLPRQYRGKPANLLFAIEYADALGIPRVNALTSIHVIDGKPSASADLMASMVRKAGHKLRVKVEGTGKQATAIAQVIRADDPDFTYEVRWTWQDALTAGLGDKDNWRKYPTSMMKARAISAVIREGASDAMMGVIYTPEELGAVVDQDGNPVSAVTSNAPTRATVVHPLQDNTPTPESAPRPAIDIAADIADNIGVSDDAVRDLWREARRAGYGDLVDAVNTLMTGGLTKSEFVETWITGPLGIDPIDETTPETAHNAPQGRQDTPGGTSTPDSTNNPGNDDTGDIVDAEPLPTMPTAP